LACIAVLGLAAYSNTFDSAFVFDDRPSIVDNHAIRGFAAFAAAEHRSNRIVGYFTFAVNHELGGLDPTGYHVLNLAIHLANAFLVYALVLLAFRSPRLQASALSRFGHGVAFAAAALFVAHPIQTQAVTYVVQRLTSLATTFYLATVVQYAAWRLRPVGGERWRGAARYVAMLATAILAMRTKEISATLPVAVLLYEASFFGPIRARHLLTVAPFFATALLIPLSMVTDSQRAGLDVLSRVEDASRVQTAMSRWDYATTQLAVVATYLRLLVLPVGQNLDHEYPLQTSLFAPRVIASALLLAGLAAAAGWLHFRRGLDGAARLVSFGIAWFFVALAVESSVFPIRDVILEHRVYLPSAGLFVAAVSAAGWLAHRWAPARGQRGMVTVALAVAVALGATTFHRNRVWKDEVSLWSDVVSKSPNNARGHNSLGAALEAAGRRDEAIRSLGTALRIDPTHAEAYYNLGRIYLSADMPHEDAVALFAAALRLRPDWPEAYANMAAALNLLRRYGETIRLLDGAEGVVRDHAEARFNLGVAYAGAGQRDAALAELRNLQRLSPVLAARFASFLNP
jgi:Flp pilus assembly protein TadD